MDKAKISDLLIRTINPDNKVEIRDLVHLFRRVYGKSFPISSVYDEAFWSSHVGIRFNSLVAIHEGRIVGHCAIYPEKGVPNIVQLNYMLCDPMYRHLLPGLCRETWQIISKQSIRQNWNMIYNFTFGSSPFTQLLQNKVLNGHEVALMPAYLPNSKMRPRGLRIKKGAATENDRGHVLISQRTFSPNKLTSRTIYAPKSHRDIIRYLYAPLNLPRVFDYSNSIAKLEKAVYADFPAVDMQSFTTTKVRHVYIQPSLVNMPSKTVSEIEDSCPDPSAALYLFINLSDPRCPDFCDMIENRGYKFCGVLPVLQGRDSIIFWRENQNSDYFNIDNFYSESARVLARYLGTPSFDSAIEEAKAFETRSII